MIYSARKTFLLCTLSILLPFIAPSVFGENPARVVSLAPNLTELVYALGLGDHLVGRSSACDYPSEVESVPVVGGFGRPNLELLASLHPDCVLITDVENKGFMKWLKQEHIRALILPCENWDELFSAARTISAICGDPSAGDAWNARMSTAMAAIRQKKETLYRREGRKSPRVYVEVWGDPLTTAGRETFLDSVITLAGGYNIARDLGKGYLHPGAEWVVRENPDVIVLAYMLNGAAARNTIDKRVGWSGMKAVRDHAICDEIDPDLLLRPGPRLIDGAEQLAAWLDRRMRDDE